MTAYTDSFKLSTRGHCDAHDVTDRAASAVRDAGIESGLCTVFTPGSTAGVTTIEYESGALEDLARHFDETVPEQRRGGRDYSHNARWGDGNGFSHLRAALLGPSVTVPVNGGRLALGTWQQIIVIDFDNRPRNRDVVIQVVGE